jgi:hypothetical protein
MIARYLDVLGLVLSNGMGGDTGEDSATAALHQHQEIACTGLSQPAPTSFFNDCPQFRHATWQHYRLREEPSLLSLHGLLSLGVRRYGASHSVHCDWPTTLTGELVEYLPPVPPF